MPKKQKRPKAEIHAMIEKEAQVRIGCAEFERDFTVGKSQDARANWDVESARHVEAWAPDCAQAFKEAVARARRKFDIAWGLSD